MYTGPNIITNGLILELDAANNKSYPGSGTTWFDKSGNRYNGTLTNGPTFNSTNGGTIVFDGINDYVLASDPGSISRYTVESWFRPTAYPNNNACVVTSVFSNVVNFKIGYEGGSDIYGGFYNGTWRLSPTVPTTLNQWQSVTHTYDGANLAIYNNGISNGSNAYVGTPSSNGLGIRIGMRWDLANMFSGNIAVVRIYNRALTSLEILQNYNATKSRFFPI